MIADKDLFNDPEPFSASVKPEELLNEIVETLNKYIVLPEGGDMAIALWLSHAHCLDAFELSPFLQIKSPMKPANHKGVAATNPHCALKKRS